MKTPNLHRSWSERITSVFEMAEMNRLRDFLQLELKNNRIYPPMKEVFNAFLLTPFDEIKVVILGQDPYHQPGQAHGLSFSVLNEQPPPSLKNIFKEIDDDFEGQETNHKVRSGNLTDWAQQGVFLLNTVLTVRRGQPGSHRERGWEFFTDRVIETLNGEREHLVFILWGSMAQKKIDMIDTNRHLILTSAHPSPLSSYRGFLGSKPFSKANEYLIKQGLKPIFW